MKRNPFLALARLIALAVLPAFLAGCSGGQPTGSVSGTVTLGGAPLSAGCVQFTNQASGIGQSAELDALGAYQVRAFRWANIRLQFPPLPHRPRLRWTSLARRKAIFQASTRT
ncbi:MAG: hypothetical protein U1E05_09380 [Patescibacteria group bacterium]|nr:hypothetical protein [Patescibacteria group bacterium]